GGNSGRVAGDGTAGSARRRPHTTIAPGHRVRFPRQARARKHRRRGERTRRPSELKRPRLVAFDLDGTLIGEDLHVRPRVADAIAAMRALGVQGCIVTGRMYRAALPFARALGFEAPVICYQGAAVIDPLNDEVLLDVPLANEA